MSYIDKVQMPNGEAVDIHDTGARESIDSLNTSIKNNANINLLPVEKTNGKYIKYTDGLITNGANFFYTNYINIGDYDEILYSNYVTTSESPAGGMAFYEEANENSYISGVQAETAETGFIYARKKIKIPYNAKYARFSGIVESKTDDVFYLFGIKNNKISSIPCNKVSIIGDSVSTFNEAGYKTRGYSQWYPNVNIPEVNDVNKTWFKMFIDASGAVLEKNVSYSGSRVTNTDAEKPDFYARANSNIIGNPDTIIVALGSNDSTHNVAIGNYDFTTATESLDESTFRTAYIKGLKTLQTKYPNASILCVIFAMDDDYSNSIKFICKTLNIEYVEVRDYERGYTLHPSAKGMKEIACAVSFPSEKNKKFYYTNYEDLITPTSAATISQCYVLQTGNFTTVKIAYKLNANTSGNYTAIGTLKAPFRPLLTTAGYGFRFSSGVQYPIYDNVQTNGQVRHYGTGDADETDTVYFIWYND